MIEAVGARKSHYRVANGEEQLLAKVSRLVGKDAATIERKKGNIARTAFDDNERGGKGLAVFGRGEREQGTRQEVTRLVVAIPEKREKEETAAEYPEHYLRAPFHRYWLGGLGLVLHFCVSGNDVWTRLRYDTARFRAILRPDNLPFFKHIYEPRRARIANPQFPLQI